MLSSVAPAGVTIFDLDHLASLFGKAKWHDQRFWYHSKHAFAFDAVGMTAFHGSMLVRAIKGRARKCVVVDLDNTLWGGVIGDEGLKGIVLGSGPEGEALVDFQSYLLQLKNRGVILAVCSKNDEENAREPFRLHTDMKISLEDISVFKANWNNKADNIIEIAETLNIGTDSIVFIDDDPAERDLVRRFLPEVAVPEMPSDPTEYIQALDGQGLFEAITFSEEDRIRTDLYRKDANRSEFKKTFTDLSEYLLSLDMEATVSHFDSFHLPRVSQIINKSNQFHLTNKRYNESEIKSILSDPRFHCRFFKLKDRFGDNGLIAVIMLCLQEDATLLVDSWVMSCRVLSRGMEEFICSEIVDIGKQLGCGKIVGKYVPTKKNSLVSDLYKRLQFSPVKKNDDAEYWELDLESDLPEYKTFIRCLRNK
jgi:FkbH-like protein